MNDQEARSKRCLVKKPFIDLRNTVDEAIWVFRNFQNV